MNKLLFIISVLFAQISFAQNTFKATIISDKTKEVLMGATAQISILQKGGIANEKGEVTINNIPDGEYEIIIRYLGFEEKRKKFAFPLTNPDEKIEIDLEPSASQLEEVIVTSTTRSSRNISDISTRIEVIVGEELDEKSSMKPNDIKMLLNESKGIATQ